MLTNKYCNKCIVMLVNALSNTTSIQPYCKFVNLLCESCLHFENQSDFLFDSEKLSFQCRKHQMGTSRTQFDATYPSLTVNLF